MDDCIFCKIIRGEIPSYKVYEDELVYAFLDISQTTPGHTLLVPKKHVKDIFAYDADMARAVFSRLPKLARAIRDSNPAITGMNILNNNGAVAYQSVFHSHIHLIPRYSKNDDFGIRFANNADKYDQTRYEAVQEAIVTQVQREAQ